MAARCGCQKILVCGTKYLPTRSFHGGARTLQKAAAAQHKDGTEDIKIQIPKRKKRGPTAVLDAMAANVKKDFDAPHYKYIDDPFLIPTNALEKRVFSLAKASGQKAARFVLDKYPKFSTVHEAMPNEQSFGPTPRLQLPDDQESGLVERISRTMPLAAYETYQKIKQAGGDISESTLQDLLDLLCMYNSEDPPDSVLPEEAYFIRNMGQDNSRKIVKTWKSSGAAEQVFASMESPSTKAYSSMIRGRAKYNDVQNAYDLYEEMKSKKMKIGVETYNAVLSVAVFVHDRSEKRWELVQSLLGDMAEDDTVSPNLDTFNTVLQSLSKMRSYRSTTKWSMTVINEMRDQGIEPSLASYANLLNIFYFNDEESSLLSEIMDHIEGQEFTLTCSQDCDFFAAAMAKCLYSHKDMDLAYKVDALLNHGNNMMLLGDGYREGTYYSNLLKLLCMFEQIDTIMEHYRRVTPHAYTPTFVVIDELLKAIELNDGYQYLPEIWSDLILFDYNRQSGFIETILTTMAKKKHDTQLQNHFVKICDDILAKVISDSENRRLMKPLTLTGPMVGDMVVVALNADSLDKAWEYFQFYYDIRFKVEMFPSESSMVMLTEKILSLKDSEKAMQCLTVLGDCAYPKTEGLIQQAKAELELDDIQKQKLDDFL